MKKGDTTKKAAVHVLGCKVNQAEAAAMSRILEEKGYSVDADEACPDLIVVNTCCVTARAEGKSRRAIKHLAEKFPTARIVIGGCLAEVNPDSVQGVSGDRLILGTFDKDRFADSIERRPGDAAPSRGHRPDTFGDLGVARIPGRARAFLKVQDGCSQACTYCIVPRARGRSRSLPAARALEYARDLAGCGVVEIVLTGVHLGAYGRDLSPDLSLVKLTEMLLESCPSARFRLSSLEPQEITESLIDLVTGNPRVCRHFHIPLQSGDDGILERMGRPYDTDLIRRVVRLIRERSPENCLGMDVMVGFPGEDDRSFGKTKDFIESLSPAYLHVFPYSVRPGTPAAAYEPRVSAVVSQRRVEELRELSRALRRAFMEQCAGMIFHAVPEKDVAASESFVIARTDNYIKLRVEVPEEARHLKAFRVRVENVSGEEIYGTFVP